MDHFRFMEFDRGTSHSNPLCICTSNGVDDKPQALFLFNADVDIRLYVPHAPLSNAENLQQPFKSQLDKGDFW